MYIVDLKVVEGFSDYVLAYLKHLLGLKKDKILILGNRTDEKLLYQIYSIDNGRIQVLNNSNFLILETRGSTKK